MRRKASWGKRRVSITFLELVRGFPKGGQKPAVSFSQLLPDSLRCRVDEGGRRAVEVQGSRLRVLLQDGRDAERLDALLRPFGRGGRLNAAQEIGDPGAVRGGSQMPPAGKRAEDDRLAKVDFSRLGSLAAEA